MRCGAATAMVTGAIWPGARPAAAMLLAYESDPALAALRLDFTTALREVLEVLIGRPAGARIPAGIPRMMYQKSPM